MREVHRLMENEKAQNERLPEPYRSEVLRGADCNEIARAVGEFGRDPRNPIPVNGPSRRANLFIKSTYRRLYNRSCSIVLAQRATLTFMRQSVSTARYGIFSFFIRFTRESRSARLLAIELSPARNATAFCWALTTSLPPFLTVCLMQLQI